MNIDSSTLSQIQSLLGNNSGKSSGASLLDTNAIIQAMMPLTIIATIISLLFVALYVFSIIQRIRVERAILESRDLLREMNAREKTKETPISEPRPDATPNQ